MMFQNYIFAQGLNTLYLKYLCLFTDFFFDANIFFNEICINMREFVLIDVRFNERIYSHRAFESAIFSICEIKSKVI